MPSKTTGFGFITCTKKKQYELAINYKPKTLEEKIMVVADTLSHFTSVFYLTYFKFHPKHSLETMVKCELEKLGRDWRDLGLLPRAKSMAKEQYKILKSMLKNYVN